MKVLLRIGTFILALGIGYVIGSIRFTSKHIKTEYFLELKPNKVLIESSDGHIMQCNYGQITNTLIKDNQ